MVCVWCLQYVVCVVSPICDVCVVSPVCGVCVWCPQYNVVSETLRIDICMLLYSTIRMFIGLVVFHLYCMYVFTLLCSPLLTASHLVTHRS